LGKALERRRQKEEEEEEEEAEKSIGRRSRWNGNEL